MSVEQMLVAEASILAYERSCKNKTRAHARARNTKQSSAYVYVCVFLSGLLFMSVSNIFFSPFYFGQVCCMAKRHKKAVLHAERKHLVGYFGQGRLLYESTRTRWSCRNHCTVRSSYAAHVCRSAGRSEFRLAKARYRTSRINSTRYGSWWKNTTGWRTIRTWYLLPVHV